MPLPRMWSSKAGALDRIVVHPHVSLKRARPLAKGSQPRVTRKGRPCSLMFEIKWPLLNPYTAQSNCERMLAAHVTSEWYRGADEVAPALGWDRPKRTG